MKFKSWIYTSRSKIVLNIRTFFWLKSLENFIFSRLSSETHSLWMFAFTPNNFINHLSIVIFKDFNSSSKNFTFHETSSVQKDSFVLLTRVSRMPIFIRRSIVYLVDRQSLRLKKISNCRKISRLDEINRDNWFNSANETLHVFLVYVCSSWLCTFFHRHRLKVFSFQWLQWIL